MGSVDAVEIIGIEKDPRQLVLRLHTSKSELAISLDSAILKNFLTALPLSDAKTYRLRGTSHSETPLFFCWRIRRSYEALVRIKCGASREQLAIPCAKFVHESLLKALKSDYAGTTIGK